MTAKDFNIFLANLSKLSKSQLEQISDKVTALSTGNPTLQTAVPEKCPKCFSPFVKNGTRDGKQRYRCKCCGCTFGDTYGTPVYRCRLTQQIVKSLIEGTLNGLSLRRIAKIVGVNRNTVWLFRKKLSAALTAMPDIGNKFNAIAEADEYFTPLSFKGKRDLGFFLNVLGRMPRHNRSKSEKEEYLLKNGFNPADYTHILADKKRKRGISNEQICVFTCTDRSNITHINPVGVGRITEKQIGNELDGKLASDSILVSDSNHGYGAYARKNGIHLRQIPSGKHTLGPFNLGRVNALHSRLSAYEPPEVRVASKYLADNLAMFAYIDKTRKAPIKEQVNGLVELFVKHAGYSGLIDFRAKSLGFDVKGLAL